MCGIAGILREDVDLREQEQLLCQMSDSLRSRGPDDSGRYLEPGAALLHRRLAIIDPAGGRQPMRFGDLVIAYNGEIYNTAQVRHLLESAGYSFETTCDTEVVLKAYHKWKAGCLEKLNGIFAFAVYDTRRGTLFAARDRIGVKPLFYCKKGRLFAFASRIPTLLLLPEVEPVVDRSGLAEIFMLGPARSPGHAVFRDLAELPPACYLTYDHGALQVHRYWKLHAAPHTDSPADTIERTHQLVTDAVERQLVSDVPLACFLSGGLDSSILSMLAAKDYAARGETLHTWSVDYRDNDKYFTKSIFQPNSDDSYIDQMVDFLGTHHHRVVLEPEALCAALLPATDARALPGMADVDSSLLLFCAAVKRGGTTVCLSGECADELFGGYPWYHREEILFEDTFPWSRSVGLRLGLLTPDAVRNGEEFVRQHYRDTCDRAPKLSSDDKKAARMREMFVLNLDWFMATLLDRKDRMSMYSGLEVRVPFCDHRIVEYAYNMPWDFKSLEGREKGIVRRAFADELPKEIVYRKKSPYPKTFHPVYTRLCADYVRRIFEDNTSVAASLFDRNAVQKLMRRPESLAEPWFGQLMRTPQIFAYIIQLDRWFRHYHVKIV